MGRKKDDDEEDQESSDEEMEAVEELLREELGGSEESDYDSEDIPLGAKEWKGKGGGEGGGSDSSSGSDDSDDSSEDGAKAGEGETKEVEWNETADYSQQGEYDQSAEWGNEYDQSAESGYEVDVNGYDDSGYAAEGGGGEWQEVYDEESGTNYWYNNSTGESKWE